MGTYVASIMAGCFVCHGTDAHWMAPNAMALAARHHSATGHPTWCDRVLATRYGDRPPAEPPAPQLPFD